MSTIDAQRIQYLLELYSEDKASSLEEQELLKWVAQNEDSEVLKSFIRDLSRTEDLPTGYATAPTDAMLELIKARIAHPEKPPAAVINLATLLRKWGWAAACVVLLLGISGYFLSRQQPAQARPTASKLPADIAHGHQGAILTLDNGRQIVLDSLRNGLIATQYGSKVLLKNGEVAYQAADAEKVSYNTMTTPKGRQYQVVLPDGTKVWLNAESSITYPTVFTGKERKVEMTGEAYFEVVRNKESPFLVSVNHSVVMVLGTHFNIRGYGDENETKTTLLEGAVLVSTGDQHSLLAPGQQARVGNSSGITSIQKEADLDAVMAWKNGFFSFQNAGLKKIMQEISRWYDVNVVYESAVPDITFSGDIGRNLSLAQLLSALNEMGVDFKIEGNKLKIIHI